MATINVNGTTLYYEESGNGPSMLFIHGMAGFAAVWADQVTRLSDAFHCVAYDRRGHTHSSRGDITPETVELHADDAAALIKGLNLAPVILAASSGGARISLDVLRRYPELVRGAALSEPPVFSLAPMLGKDFMGRVKPSVESSLASDKPQMAVDAFFRIVDPILWDNMPDERREMYRTNLPAMLADLQQPLYQITPDDLAKINCPCLMMYGTNSEKSFSQIAKMVADALPNCQLVELTGAGHATYAHQPVAFAAAVRQFALSLPRGG